MGSSSLIRDGTWAPCIGSFLATGTPGKSLSCLDLGEDKVLVCLTPFLSLEWSCISGSTTQVFPGFCSAIAVRRETLCNLVKKHNGVLSEDTFGHKKEKVQTSLNSKKISWCPRKCGPQPGLIQGLYRVAKNPVPCHLCFIPSPDLFVAPGWLLAIPGAPCFFI